MLYKLIKEIDNLHAQKLYLESLPLIRECIVTHNHHVTPHICNLLIMLPKSELDKFQNEQDDVGSMYLSAMAYYYAISCGYMLSYERQRMFYDRAIEKGHMLSLYMRWLRLKNNNYSMEDVYIAAKHICPLAILLVAQLAETTAMAVYYYNQYCSLIYPPEFTHFDWVRTYNIFMEHVYTIECSPFGIWEPTHVVHRCCHPRVHDTIFEWLLVAGRIRGVDRYLKLLICSYIVTQSQWY
jgi:hypothetical protein